jgi:hypothetical protein
MRKTGSEVITMDTLHSLYQSYKRNIAGVHDTNSYSDANVYWSGPERQRELMLRLRSQVHRKKRTPVRTDAERAYSNVGCLHLGGDNMQIV